MPVLTPKLIPSLYLHHTDPSAPTRLGISILGLTLCLGVGCDDTPVDTSSAGAAVQAGMQVGGQDVPLAGFPVAGESSGAQAGDLAGDPAGDPAGDLAGDLAGEPGGGQAGEPAGEQGGDLAGEQAGDPGGDQAGDQAGGPAGEQAGDPAGEQAGDPAGEQAGDPAGEQAGTQGGDPAGERAGAPAGEQAGDPSGEMMPDNSNPIIIQGSIPQNGLETHSFSLSQSSGVRIRTMGSNGASCPAGADTTMLLSQVTSGGQERISFNDDYPNDEGHLCSQITSVLEPGDYVVTVQGYRGMSVPSYVLEIIFTPILAIGDACDADDPMSGTCPTEGACVEGVCAEVIPTISEVSATRAGDTLFLNVRGRDEDLDAFFFILSIYDADGTQLILDTETMDIEYFSSMPNGTSPLTTNEPNFSFQVRVDLFNLDQTEEVEVIIQDFEFNRSAPVRASLDPHPVLMSGAPCDLEEFTGRCEMGYLCIVADDMDPTCVMGTAPEVMGARLSSGGDVLIASILGSDLNQDISAVGLTLYDEQGTALVGGPGLERATYPVEAQRIDPNAPMGYERYYITLTGDFIAQAGAAELSLIDSLGLQSQVLIALRAPLPQRAVDEACDSLGLDDVCAQGVCYLGIDGASSCREGLPAIGDFCEPELGCDEGLICYGPTNGGQLTERFNTCMRACDANIEPDGCEIHELCLPDFDWASLGITDRASPGVCLSSDHCIPGQEAESCGLDNASCLRLDNITLCVDLSELLPAEISSIGETCFGIRNPCEMGSVCEAGSCRAACADDSECAGDQTCRTFDEVTYPTPEGQYAGCIGACDPITQDCSEEGQACVIFSNESSDGLLSTCQDATTGEGDDGASCTPGINGGYWGDCAASHFCGATFRDRLDLCTPICTIDDTTPCTDDRVCDINMIDVSDAGLCVGECNVFTDERCEAGQTCLLGVQGQDNTGETHIRGACYANPNPGTAPTGGACIYDMATNTSDCAAGHLCADLTVEQTGMTECVRLCQANSDEVLCPINQSCVNLLPDGSPVFGETLSELGVCF